MSLFMEVLEMILTILLGLAVANISVPVTIKDLAPMKAFPPLWYVLWNMFMEGVQEARARDNKEKAAKEA